MPKSGLSTTDNNRFLRLWFEPSIQQINFRQRNRETTERRFFPYVKGGSFRRWYGNMEYVVNWESDGVEIRQAAIGASGGRVVNPELYFKSYITWTKISTGLFSMRYCPEGTIFSDAGGSLFLKDLSFYLAFCNSKVCQHFLNVINQTLNYVIGSVANLPIMGDKKEFSQIVAQNVKLSKDDWDSFEISWDFECHPLLSVIPKNYILFDDMDHINLAQCFACWEKECSARFDQLKANEEELNRIFIDIYGLQEELTPEVEDKDITVRKADLGRDIRSLISYAVGCMFGRYSVAEKGLIYAGGKFDRSRYGDFPADDDGIIPITDEAYFDDDIIGRFEEFIQTVFGTKSLEDNLDYIAAALGTKGVTSREKIRTYFLKDFFKDHCNTYSVAGSGKRPIYWLFDSGRQNGFKALIYMHRYTPDTVGLVRSVYLKKVSEAIEASLKNAEYIISENISAVDVAQATKKRDKYVKQLAEIKPYYQALSHVAMQRIPLDLDDGVKVNYAKFQGIEVAEDGGKRQTIDLLAKI